MPKAFKKSTDRQRKEKFTPEELNMLTQTLAENADVVFANDMQRPTILKKKAIWEQVAVKVSAVGTSTRTVRECRKRWDDLRLRVRGILAENHRIASEGGAGSPTRLKEWEETCGNLIAVESIEGVGSMEVGVGSHTDGEDAADASLAPATSKRPRAQESEDTPTTSRGKGGRSHLMTMKHRRSATVRAAVPVPQTAATPLEEIPQAPIAATEGPPSAAASSAGEAAATAPLSDPEDTIVDPMGMHTPSPPSTAEPAPFQTPEENNPAIMSPMEASPAAVDASEGTASSAQSPSTALQLTTILERHRELTVLVGQHVEEVAHLRENIAETARHSTDRMDANTDRLCTEISRLREVLSRMADAMDRHFLQQGQSAPSSSSGSRQTSPLRRSTRTTRRSSVHSQNAATDNAK
ncbi:myb-related transcription factor, partner of profilin-like [Ambystoma mexicanum]|uniref:myb-related transcription factor, partner of profilin-like n=1 Tax=Ambystoma mexicanum TaxID=8296 RepID=UPI0037E98AF9